MPYSVEKRAAMIVLGHRLFLARRKRGGERSRFYPLSQTEVGEALGRGRDAQSYVQKCETGTRRIDVFELVEFARYYGVTLGHFLKEDDAQEAAVRAAFIKSKGLNPPMWR